MEVKEKQFQIASEEAFISQALEIFRYQYRHNLVYHDYVEILGVKTESVTKLEEIPFLPIEFFKTHDVICGNAPPQAIFKSSGTTGVTRSRHSLNDLTIYRHSLQKGFSRFYGPPEEVQFLALTPTPEQAPDSSLIFMVQHLMDLSLSPENGYFLTSFSGLTARLKQRRPPGKKVMLIGLTYALLQFAENYPGDYSPLIVVETGGMKGRRKEITREELHGFLTEAFRVETIHSEYGMTELLSQAWSKGEGLFSPVPWMKVLIRDVNDPFSYAEPGQTGGINVIDLANQHSCSFIATQDLGRLRQNGQFEVLGRFESGDVRGCSLMSW
ncbi:MAG: acyl transferase [Bacteroidota bacterium]